MLLFWGRIKVFPKLAPKALKNVFCEANTKKDHFIVAMYIKKFYILLAKLLRTTSRFVGEKFKGSKVFH